ncbi:hypothetical protein AB0L40_25955 [Patulibacter sp. NPDC049589]|uniref:hypothetical protein n=1 Tax=Patulibacter sp. NPDC049589 TaxID=3154731 RepID=UPI003445F5C1
MSGRMARRGACPGTGAVDRRSTPDALRDEASSVHHRLRAVSGAALGGGDVSIVELDAITSRLVDLQWRIGRAVPERHGATALQELLEARGHLRASSRAVAELVAHVAPA